jgi:uncharacterized protein (DUF362 family)
MDTIDRRRFIERMLAMGGSALAAAALLSLPACSSESAPMVPGENTTVTPPSPPPAGAAYLAVARGEDAAALVRRSVAALGGIERFVKPGNDVIIKPNICTANRAPEYAATTNPEVVAALVSLCLGAGAGRVRVMDYPFSGGHEEAYSSSGIAEAVAAAGGEMEVMAKMKFQDTPAPHGLSLASCRVYQDILDADVLIDVPIAKQHGNTVLTLGMKNLLGVVDNPSSYHTAQMSERVVDLNTLVRPHLIVVDAIRILLNNGPTGGSLNDVKRMNTVIASHDIVAADSFGATLFGKTALDLPIVQAGARRGVGNMDLNSMKIEEIPV